ncbi:ornithine cyclodeaminase [Ilumatobacter nonamiensis]|uniref:ornithine cyclodeaminase n=1 Tax=Ilumatobacter nonamiensis TaxID=467093 RepID=UPI00034A7B05|nr:ornithine cyclodeaminase [Ilumatobacter nonamiensis]
MVRFVNVQNLGRWAADTGLEPLLRDLTTELEGHFQRWPLFDKTPRVGSHSQHGVIELMPTSDGITYGFKCVNGHPINSTRGLQTVTAFGALSDVDTGYPIMLSEMTLLTALRTAATSAMAAKVLAPVNATTMALIGSGAQSEFQALAFRANLGINTLRVFDVDPAAMAKFERNATALDFDVTLCGSVEEAITGAHVVTTCTADKKNATVLTDEMVTRACAAGGVTGLHINAIGGDCPGKTELDIELVKRGSVFVEYPEQTFIEGEIQTLPHDWPLTELWQVLTGDAVGRSSDDELTIFDSVGFAIEDFAALVFLNNRLDGTDYYDEIDLIAEPADPKDLFALLPVKQPATIS